MSINVSVKRLKCLIAEAMTPKDVTVRDFIDCLLSLGFEKVPHDPVYNVSKYVSEKHDMSVDVFHGDDCVMIADASGNPFSRDRHGLRTKNFRNLKLALSFIEKNVSGSAYAQTNKTFVYAPVRDKLWLVDHRKQRGSYVTTDDGTMLFTGDIVSIVSDDGDAVWAEVNGEPKRIRKKHITRQSFTTTKLTAMPTPLNDSRKIRVECISYVDAEDAGSFREKVERFVQMMTSTLERLGGVESFNIEKRSERDGGVDADDFDINSDSRRITFTIELVIVRSFEVDDFLSDLNVALNVLNRRQYDVTMEIP